MIKKRSVNVLEEQGRGKSELPSKKRKEPRLGATGLGRVGNADLGDHTAASDKVFQGGGITMGVNRRVSKARHMWD